MIDSYTKMKADDKQVAKNVISAPAKTSIVSLNYGSKLEE